MILYYILARTWVRLSHGGARSPQRLFYFALTSGSAAAAGWKPLGNVPDFAYYYDYTSANKIHTILLGRYICGRGHGRLQFSNNNDFDFEYCLLEITVLKFFVFFFSSTSYLFSNYITDLS